MDWKLWHEVAKSCAETVLEKLAEVDCKKDIRATFQLIFGQMPPAIQSVEDRVDTFYEAVD